MKWEAAAPFPFPILSRQSHVTRVHGSILLFLSLILKHRQSGLAGLTELRQGVKSHSRERISFLPLHLFLSTSSGSITLLSKSLASFLLHLLAFLLLLMQKMRNLVCFSGSLSRCQEHGLRGADTTGGHTHNDKWMRDERLRLKGNHHRQQQ